MLTFALLVIVILLTIAVVMANKALSDMDNH